MAEEDKLSFRRLRIALILLVVLSFARWGYAGTFWEKIKWNHDGSLLAAQIVQGIRIFSPDLETVNLIRPESMRYVFDFDWSPNGNQVALAGEGLRLFNALTSEQESVLDTDGSYQRVKWSPDGQKLISIEYSDENIDVWAATTHELLLSLDFEHDTDVGIYWSADSSLLAFVGGYNENLDDKSWINAIYIVDAVTGNLLQTIHHPTAVHAMRWHPNGTLAVNFVRSLWFYDPITGEEVASLRLPEDPYGLFEWSPDGSLVVQRGAFTSMEGQHNLLFVDLTTGEIGSMIEVEDEAIDSFTWSPVGNVLAIMTSQDITTWDISQLSEVKQIADVSTTDLLSSPSTKLGFSRSDVLLSD